MIGRVLISGVLVVGLFVFFAFNIYANDEDDMKMCKEFGKYVNRIQYRLPFDGEWSVLWGGCKKKDNLHHRDVDEQRFAYDFVKVSKNGKIHRGRTKTLADYYSYDEPVLAPANGIVENVVDGIEDSPLGASNKYFIPGNMVTIAHTKDEFSFLAHLKPGSITVRRGQRVKMGQVIARTGNSGNSTMPHIHYQLTNKARFQDGIGLPITFTDYLSNNKPIQCGRPLKGEIVKNVRR